MDKTRGSEVAEDPSKSSYALKLLKENESLKGKLAQLESSAPMCFHGKHLPPNLATPTCQDDLRACIEQSHANFQHQQSHIKSQVNVLKCYFLSCCNFTRFLKNFETKEMLEFVYFSKILKMAGNLNTYLYDFIFLLSLDLKHFEFLKNGGKFKVCIFK